MAAVDVAHAAAAETGGPDAVGEHLRHDAEGERVVTHHFACTLPGYIGWEWAVTVVRASRSKTVTVDECVLLPGPESVLAPAWVPWEERVRPEDLGPGDLIPIASDDTRLVPGYTDVANDTDVRELVEELGLGREWVLSREARDDAAQRWYDSEGGPDTPIAKAAPASCGTCGFAIPLVGTLGRLFGVCTNERTPFDGKVVSIDHGCGGHTDVRLPPPTDDSPEPVVDTLSYELVPFDAADGSATDEDAQTPDADAAGIEMHGPHDAGSDASATDEVPMRDVPEDAAAAASGAADVLAADFTIDSPADSTTDAVTDPPAVAITGTGVPADVMAATTGDAVTGTAADATSTSADAVTGTPADTATAVAEETAPSATDASDRNPAGPPVDVAADASPDAEPDHD